MRDLDLVNRPTMGDHWAWYSGGLYGDTRWT